MTFKFLSGVITIEFGLTMRWTDPEIKAKFIDSRFIESGFSLSLAMADEIWIPDFYLYNVSDYKSFKDSIQITRLRVLSGNAFNDNQTIVGYRMEAKAMIYCGFYLSRYPLDHQECLFRFGSQVNDIRFVLFDVSNTFHQETKYQAVEFEIDIAFSEDSPNEIDPTTPVGFNIGMDRVISPYIFKCYLPCFAIVAASSISFIIPLSAIPGRVALMVTQFLTLTNLFIYQMVYLSQK
jgi:hypothetical protein